MRNFLRGMVVGGILVYIGMALSLDAQTDEPLTLRVPTIVSDTTWTPQQRADLIRQWNNFVIQQSMVNRTFAERMRKID